MTASSSWWRLRSAGGWTAYALAVFGLSTGASLLRPDGAATSLWWPAAGVAAAGALLLPPRQRPAAVALVVVVTAVANAVTGRPAEVAVAFGVANAAEVAVVLALLCGRGKFPELARLADMGRLALAVSVGALTAGAGAGTAVWVLVGGSLVGTWASVTASHLSALLLVVPLVLHRRRGPRDAARLETALQTSLLVALLAYSFGPRQELPLSLLPLVALVWAGARLSATAAVLQLLGSAVAVTLATMVGWGPYATGTTAVLERPLVTVALVQTFIIVSAVVTLTLVAVVQERRSALTELAELALRDDLTGLPNRRLLLDRLAQAAASARHENGRFTVLLVDLDGFKQVNDAGGHDAGDQVLVETARRLLGSVRPGDTVARMGGDEFAVVCPDLDPGPASYDLVARLQAALDVPILTGSGVFRVGASIGLAHGTGRTDPQDALRAADQTMYAVKRDKPRAHGRDTAPA